MDVERYLGNLHLESFELVVITVFRSRQHGRHTPENDCACGSIEHDSVLISIFDCCYGLPGLGTRRPALWSRYPFGCVPLIIVVTICTGLVIGNEEPPVVNIRQRW